MSRRPTAPALRLAGRILFGSATFEEGDEYQIFRYRFLIVLMVSGALLTGLFIVGTLSQVNPIAGPHGVSMLVFTGVTTALWLWLRGHPGRLTATAWTYEAIGLLEYTSALVFVPTDELRVLWFFVNVPGVFILLGQRAGWAVTLLTSVGLVIGNARLSAPYSTNAMATALLSLLYLGVMFHAYVDRSLSYFQRMRDYNRKLQDLASHDALTGVMNARAYYAACNRQLLVSQRSNKPFAVLFIDLDHFKRINDSHGHAAGDAVLRIVAAVLQQGIRRSDLLGRIGGEEFSVFLPETDLAGATQLAEKLRAAVQASQPDIGAAGSITVTASLGVATSDGTQASFQAIQEQADAAMYQAKQAGRNRVSVLAAASGD